LYDAGRSGDHESEYRRRDLRAGASGLLTERNPVYGSANLICRHRSIRPFLPTLRHDLESHFRRAVEHAVEDGAQLGGIDGLVQVVVDSVAAL